MKPKLILDSGAFSAWNQQKTVSLEAYTDFCLKWGHYVEYIVSLDVIPGKFGQKSMSKDEVEESAAQGWQNYQYMLSRGVPQEKLIHVYHQNEPEHWLERIVKEMDYIGLSPANDRTTQEKIKFLDDCMKICTDSTKMPIVKFHGFAVTSHLLMTRYPWASVDSTSWVQVSRHGAVYAPKKTAGKYDYVTKPYLIRVSEKSPAQKKIGEHFYTMGESYQRELLEYFTMLGVTMEQLESEYRKRDYVNVKFLHGLVSQLPKWPRPFGGTMKAMAI